MLTALIICSSLWWLCGLYGAAANVERISRLYGPEFASCLDQAQHLVTIILGPIGILLVMAEGGRWAFWKEKAS